MFRRIHVIIWAICLGIGAAGSLLPVMSVAEENLGPHFFQQDPTLANRMTAAPAHGRSGSPLSPTYRQIGAFGSLYDTGNGSYLNVYGPPGTDKTVPLEYRIRR